MKCFIRPVLMAAALRRRGDVGVRFAERIVDLVENASQGTIWAKAEP